MTNNSEAYDDLSVSNTYKTDCKREHCAERIVNKGLEKSSSRVTLEKRERLKSTMSSFFTI